VTVAAILAAGGRGERLGAPVPKALVLLAGEALVVHAWRALRDAGVEEVVVAAPAEEAGTIAGLLPSARVVAGGVTRTQSVRRALAALSSDVDVVLVHDAARALAPAALVARVVDAVRAGAQAVVPVLPVADTVKEVDDAGTVTRTVDRASLRAVQTPQGFRRDVLEAAHEQSPSTVAAAGSGTGTGDVTHVTDVTDDAALVERLGRPVTTVEGSAEAVKVTTPFDLLVAEALLRERSRANHGVTA
jgi:2-C-methyl-D-erythritol 4-phosphate cytidylyltransferase